MRCIGPRGKDADFFTSIWEELHRVHQEGILVEGEPVKAHNSKKEMQQMSLFEKFIIGGNEIEKKERGGMEEIWRREERALSSRKERRFMQHCKMQLVFTVWWKNGKIVNSLGQSFQRSEAKKHRTEWCAAANKYRCMRF